MGALDIFNSDAFSVVNLTDAINKVPYKPGQVLSLGLFQEKGVSTTSVMIEEKDGILYLVENKPRGASGQQNQTGKRKARSLIITHLPVEDRILADEIQGVRAFGSESQLAAVEAIVSERQLTMSNSLDATVEHLALGAIKGEILDSDGTTVIYDLFTEFGVSQASEVDFDLDNLQPAAGILRKKCVGVLRTMANNLGAATVRSAHAFCGSNFFDDLISFPEVRETYLNQQQAAELRGGYLGERVTYGGITFEEYRGSVGGTAFINTDKAHFFPVGVPGLFKLYYGPADYMETVNTIGLPKYMKQAADERFNKFVDLEAQSNPLPLCTQPKALIKGKRT
jgi:hypothetical protein